MGVRLQESLAWVMGPSISPNNGTVMLETCRGRRGGASVCSMITVQLRLFDEIDLEIEAVLSCFESNFEAMSRI
jgi:hypothetical protein